MFGAKKHEKNLDPPFAYPELMVLHLNLGCESICHVIVMRQAAPMEYTETEMPITNKTLIAFFSDFV